MSLWLRADDPFRNVTDTAGVVCSGLADELLLETESTQWHGCWTRVLWRS
jgi:hypothetical protein